MRPVGSAAELERRRRRAVRLVQGGHSLSTVARMVGAAVSAVWQWREIWRRRGEPGLKARPTPGRPAKLTPRQRQRLPRLLALGAPRVTAIPTISGPRGGSPPSSSASLRSATTRLRSAASWRNWAGVIRSPNAGRWNAMRRPSPIGSVTGGSRLKKSPAPERVSGVPGRKWLPFGSQRAPHLGAVRQDPAAGAPLRARQALGHLRRQRPSRAPSPRALLPLPLHQPHPVRGRRLLAPAAAPFARTYHPAVGRRPDSPRSRRHRSPGSPSAPHG